MLRDAGRPKVHGWLVDHVIKKSAHAEALRRTWLADADPVVASAGWALTTDRVAKAPDGLTSPGCSTSSRRSSPMPPTACSGR